MKQSEKDELRNILREALGPVVAADMQAVIQENDGLRASLKAALQGTDGMTPAGRIIVEQQVASDRGTLLRQAREILTTQGKVLTSQETASRAWAALEHVIAYLEGLRNAPPPLEPSAIIHEGGPW
jgi:hypothetical protein